MKSIKNFIKDINQIIKNENIKINNLHKEVGEYETVIAIISPSADESIINFYKQKINQCYSKIDVALDNIQHNKEIIATMRTVDRIIKRGEKCA